MHRTPVACHGHSSLLGRIHLKATILLKAGEALLVEKSTDLYLIFQHSLALLSVEKLNIILFNFSTVAAMLF